MVRLNQELIPLLICLLTASEVTGDLYDANSEHYHSLCGLYSVAQATEDAIPAQPTSIAEKAKATVEQIKRLIILIDPRREDPKDPSALAQAKPAWMNESVELDDPEDRVEYKELSLSKKDQVRFHQRLTRLLRREEKFVHGLEQDVQRWGTLRTNIFGYLKQAKWGSVASAAEVALAETRTNTCGAASSIAGSSLVADIACLCVGGNSARSYTGKLCTGASIDKQWSDIQSKGAFNTEYGAQLLVPCSYPKAGPLSANNIRRRLGNFTRLLGSSVFPTTFTTAELVPKKTFNFGAGGTSGDGACEGTTNSDSNIDDYCVNYRAVVQKKGNLTGIAWYDQFEKAEEALEELAKLNDDIHQKSEHVESLRRAAWEVYFEAQFAADQNDPAGNLPTGRLSLAPAATTGDALTGEASGNTRTQISEARSSHHKLLHLLLLL